MGTLRLRVPPLRRISYMTPMMMANGINWLSWVKAVLNHAPLGPSNAMRKGPPIPRTMQPMEARYMSESFIMFCSSPVLREKRRLTTTAASMAVIPPT
jgi:hypothetical protein